MLNKISALVFTSVVLSSPFLISPDAFASEKQSTQSQALTKAKESMPVKQLSEDTLNAELVKPAIVRVVIGCKAQVQFNAKTYTPEIDGHGSGFFVNPNGYIVTNAHVVDMVEDTKECEELLAMEALDQIIEDFGDVEAFYKKYPDKESFMKDLKFGKIETKKEIILTNGDKLPFDVVIVGNQEDSGRDVAIIKVKLRNTPSLLLTDSNQVQVQEDVTAVGYPGVGDIPEEKGIGYNQPSFTNGKVSARKFINGSLVLQVSAAITNGNSGGPVINDKGEVVGISTFAYTRQSGFGFIVASNTIKDFLQQAGVDNNEGVVSQHFRKALNLYNQGQYTQAKQELIIVQRLFPQHPTVEKYLQKCNVN
jgi:serine protease Do